MEKKLNYEEAIKDIKAYACELYLTEKDKVTEEELIAYFGGRIPELLKTIKEVVNK